MNYRNLSDMSALIRKNIPHIPKVDVVVVGIPRSGMIVASMIAALTNQPLASVNELLQFSWRISRHGGRWAERILHKPKILLVDDSVSDGHTMNRVKTDLQGAHPDADITTLAVFVKPESPLPNYYFETVAGPRIFEWNWYRHGLIKKAVLDIDGVICTPTNPGERNLGVLLFAPKYMPLALATGRREHERIPTENWLARNNVPYNKLFMPRDGLRGRDTKLQAIQETKATWMVESNIHQAEWLRGYAGVPVLCTDTNTLL